MNSPEEERDEELSEWVVIQTSPTSPPIDASTPGNSLILLPSDHPDHLPDDQEEDESSSPTLNHSLPWHVIKIAKKRLKDSVFFERMCHSSYFTRSRRRVFWSFSFIGGFFLVSIIVYVRVMTWWRRVHADKLRYLLRLLTEKDQKIKELMLEIGRLNELLSSRRRVRVVRIV